MCADEPDALRERAIDLLALWHAHACDTDHGGYHNRLGHDLAPVVDDHKRLLVQTRLLWAFSEGVRLGAGDWAREAAQHAYRFLEEALQDPKNGGFFLSAGLGSAPVDARKDLYAHAFVIFALTQHAVISGDQEPLERAMDTLTLLDAHLSDPEGGGFWEGASVDWRPERGPRRQNPHMHLLEALLTLHAARSEAGLLERADALVDLCQARFVGRSGDVLHEQFEPDWTPRIAAVEPGHHFEWVWLLHAYAAAGGRRAVAPLGERLHGFARRHGVDADGLVFDAVDVQGRVVRDGKRLWPQTEQIKALAARGEHAELRSTLERVLDSYVDRNSGGWREQLDRGGHVVSDAMNATSVYHVVLALREAADALE
jgi:mannose-6-phosphate isomerase